MKHTSEFTLVRSRRKTVSIEVTPALEVIVRAPERLAKREIDAIVARRANWIESARERQRGRVRAPEPTAAEALALSQKAKETLPERVALFARSMRLAPTGIRITGAKTRFGSCSPKNSLCFSYRLMRYPPEAIDYVVVHELAHIVHKNHGRDFYALIASVMPDWRARRAMLKAPER